MDYKITIENFEGPLDLLYELITKKKLKIEDISIIEITEQYIEYIGLIDKENIDIAVDFISMATKLLDIKSRFLLYLEHSTEENPAENLVLQLERYKVFKEATEHIRSKILNDDNKFYRKKAELIFEDEIDFSNISLDKMIELLPSLFTQEEDEYKDRKEFELKEIVKKKNISLNEKIKYVRSYIQNKKVVSFSEIVESDDKDNIIAAFLCILEMIKGKEIEVRQEGTFDNIMIKKIR